MAEVIGIRFKDVGKIYYFDPVGEKMAKGDYVIVETARGVECGFVAMPNREVDDELIVKPLKSVLRKATKKDLAMMQENKQKEKEALKICEQKVKEHGLDMKLVDDVIKVNDNEAFNTSRLLAKTEGIFAGSSSGAAMAAVLKLVKSGAKGNIVTVFPDRGDRYFSTGLFD